MTSFKTRLQIYWRLLKAHWFIALCVLGFCFIAALSAQGFDVIVIGFAAVMLWFIAPYVVLLFWAIYNKETQEWTFLNPWFLTRRTTQHPQKQQVRLKPVNLAVFAVCCSLSFAAVFTHWPLRLNFLLSRSALIHEAQKIAQGKSSSQSYWVGGFYVQKSAVEQGAVCFWTQGDSQEVNRTGIIFNPKGGKPPFNLWSEVPLGDNWHVISED